jgi:flagellar hook-associated protein 2
MVSGIKSAGLASGLPINDIITQLTDLSKAPIKRLEARKTENEAKKAALQFISAQTLGLSLLSFNLSKSASFDTKKVTSSNEDALTAIASASAIAGTYKFKVGQVAQASQVTSNGFQDKTTADIGKGSFTISKGSNTLNQSTSLALINGGKGIESGSIRITDEKGNSELIDLTTSLSINDVIKKINSTTKLSLKANVSENGNSLNLSNNNDGEITVSDVNNGTLADSLGLKGKSSKGQIKGQSIVYVNADTKLANINDGLGIDITTKGINDLIINRLEGNKEVETFQVDLSGSVTVGDVLDKINTAIGKEGYAYIEEGSNKISFQSDRYKFTNAEKSTVATQLGLDGTSNSSGRLIAGLNDSLLRNLNGSNSISEGDIYIKTSSKSNTDKKDESSDKDRGEKIRVDSTSSINDFLNNINNNKKLNLTASLNTTGNGIELSTTSSEDNVQIEVTNGEGFKTATDLGLTNESSDGVLKSDNLHKRKISNNTLLSSLNGGKGVGTGSFEVQLSNGNKKVISLENKNIKTVKDAIIQIQGQFSKTDELEVRINDNGDGISLKDLSSGQGIFKISDKDDQKTAKALGIAKSAESTTKLIDGSSEVKFNVLETDSLEDVATKINNQSGLGVRASIINDGTSRESYRLSLVSDTTGADSNISIDSSIDSLSFASTAEGLDSIVSYGSSQGTGSPITLTSSDLNITGGINGLDLNIKGASDKEITISLERETESVKKTITEFTEKFNDTIKNIKNLTKFVPPDELKDTIDTGQTEEEKKKANAEVDGATGLLLGNSTLRRIQGELYNLVSSNVEGITGKVRSLSQVGIELQTDGNLKFDAAKFDEIFKTNPDEVIDVFTLSQNVLNRSTNNTGATIGGGLIVGAGFNAGNLLDGNTSSSGYDENGGAIGVKFTGKGYIDFNLGGVKNIKKLVLNQLDTTDFPVATNGLKNFIFQYKNAKGEYIDINKFTSNISGKSTYTLPESISTNNLRIEVLGGNPDAFRLLNFDAFESRGTAFKLNDQLKSFTNPDSGDLSSAISTYDKDNLNFDEQIKKIQAKVDSETDRLTRTFAAMEKTISGLQGQGNVLSQSLNNLPKS